MFRAYWRRPRFWIWWFKRGAPSEVRWGLAFIGVLAVLGAGFLAANRLSSATAVSAGGGYTVATTVERDVTVRKDGKVVVRHVPVAQLVVRRQRVVETKVEPGVSRVVTTRVVRYVPKVEEHVVTVAGRRQLVTRTVLVPTVHTQTQVVTRSQTVVNQQTATVVNAVPTTVPTTVPLTVRQTATVVSTETLPPETRTVTVTVTRTVTSAAVAMTQPVTIPTPVVTLTVTVPSTTP